MPSLPVDDLAKTIESQGHDATVDRNPRLTIEPRRQDLDSLVSEAIGALTRRSVSQRYSELDVLGEGGMGVVRLGQQRSLERPVALKSLKSGLESPSAPRIPVPMKTNNHFIVKRAGAFRLLPQILHEN